ncbi:MAG: L,D-transpeptidase family protein [Halanaerobiaceae bacterium]
MKRRLLLFILIIIFLSNHNSLIYGELEGQYRGDIWNLLNYYRINMALVTYKEIQNNGGWPVFPENVFLKKGDTGYFVSLLRERLYITGDLEKEYFATEMMDIFDEDLQNALIRFQYRHGLVEDGVLGFETIKALNEPVSEKIRKLELNRRLIYSLFDDYIYRYVLVNIPAYQLQVIEDGQEVMRMKAIIGKKKRKTPVYSDKIRYIVLNPSWRIPNTMAVNDIIPRVKNDIKYLEKRNISVFENWSDSANRLNPEKLNWSEYNINNFNFRFEQEPGPDNELGMVKFMFPNQHSIYIHDTPHKELFEHNKRAYSSGCIRIEEPLNLAVYILKDQENWSKEEILRIIDSGETEEVELEEAIPVFIVYWTAWVEENGLVHFREDIYDMN